jgi:saccharopine dehydrogenase-like NADP-dependent oxidoreductase
LQQAGFFSTDAVEVNGARVRPLDVSAKLLLQQWKLEPGEPELTVMRVTVEGEEQGKTMRHIWDLLDHYDAQTGFSSMARTTGFTCAAAANLLLQGKYRDAGVHPPEHVGRQEPCFTFIRGYLDARHVIYRHRTEAV